MHCTNCGAALEEGDRFCLSCGAPVEMQSDLGDGFQSPSQDGAVPTKKQLNKTLLIGGLVAVIVVLAVVIVLVVVKPFASKTVSLPQEPVQESVELQEQGKSVTPAMEEPPAEVAPAAPQQAGFEEMLDYYDRIGEIDGALAEVVGTFNVHYGTALGTRQADYENFVSTVVEPYCLYKSGIKGHNLSDAYAIELFEGEISPEYEATYANLRLCEELLYKRIDLQEKTYQLSLQFEDDASNKDYINTYLAEVYVLVGDGMGGNNAYNASFRELYPTVKPQKQ